MSSNGKPKPNKPNRQQTPAPKQQQRRSRAASRKRTINSIPRGVSGGNSMVNQVTMAYAHCRVDPLTAGRAVGIPDASAGKRIAVDIREYYDVKASNSGAIQATLLPCASTPLIFKDTIAASTGGLVTNSSGTSVSLTTSKPGNTPGSWINIPVTAFASYIAQDPTITPPTVNHPYYATASRIVSQAVKIMYIGKPVNASGVITVTGNEQTLNDAPSNNDSAIVRYGSDGTSLTSFAVNTTLSSVVNYNFSSPPINGAVTKPVSEGIMVLNKRRTPMSLFKTTPDQPVVLVEEDKTTALLAGSPAGTGLGGGTIADLDNSFLTPMIAISGMSANETLRFEVVTCVEYLLDNRSTFAQLAHDQPYAPLSKIQNIDRKIASLPIAAEPSFFQKAIRFILNAAPPVASAMGGPMMGAAVSTLTSSFKRSFNVY